MGLSQWCVSQVGNQMAASPYPYLFGQFNVSKEPPLGETTPREWRKKTAVEHVYTIPDRSQLQPPPCTRGVHFSVDKGCKSCIYKMFLMAQGNPLFF